MPRILWQMCGTSRGKGRSKNIHTKIRSHIFIQRIKCKERGVLRYDEEKMQEESKEWKKEKDILKSFFSVNDTECNSGIIQGNTCHKTTLQIAQVNQRKPCKGNYFLFKFTGLMVYTNYNYISINEE